MSDDSDDDNGEERLTLDDREVAFDEVVAACSAAAATHRRVSELVDDADLRDAMARLAQARQADVEALMDAMRAAGITPKAPDAERETLEGVVDRAAAFLSADDRSAALERAADHEQRLKEAIDAARGYTDGEPALRALLDEMAARRLPDASD